MSTAIAPRPLSAQGVEQDGGSSQSARDLNEEIVYIDRAGFLRVLDFMPGTVDAPRIEWYSPEGGYLNLTLGDVNDDGDQEIIAIGGDNGDGGPLRLVVYDPVVADPNAPVDGYINGVPWAKLYERALPAIPLLVDAGELVTSTPGDEIIYVTKIPDGDPDAYDRTQLTILKNASSPVDGRQWTSAVDRLGFNEKWSWMDVGDLDAAPPDEIALVANQEGLLRVYRNIRDDPIFQRRNEDNQWRAAVIGNFRNRREHDLFAIRGAKHGFPSFWVFQYTGGNIKDDYAEWLNPSPEYIFLADVENSGGDEVFMLRSVPSGYPQPRLLSRDEQGQIIIEDPLDLDNGYQAGAGGNVDADPGDEVVIMRDTAIRIYTDPRVGNAFAQFAVSTNSRAIQIGDLDASGIPPAPRFAAEPTLAFVSLPPNATGESQPIVLRNQTTSDPLPFEMRLDGEPGWASVTASNFQTPAILTVHFNSAGLIPGIYRTTLFITSNNTTVANQPFPIEVTLEVTSGLQVLPKELLFIYDAPCDPPQDVRSYIMTVVGTNGLIYSVQAVSAGGGPDPANWVTISPTSGVVPGIFKVTVDPALLANESVLTAKIVVEPQDNSSGRQDVPLTVLCAGTRLHVPVVYGP
jgi:hypothetical protein